MHSAVICGKMAEPIEMLFGLWARMGVQIPRCEEPIWGERAPIVKYRDTLTCAKIVEPIVMQFGLWLGLAQGIMI